MAKPKVCVLRTAGTNCDKETAFAFIKAGAEAEFVHINVLIGRKKYLTEYQILALPGGFSYGDDVAAGKILANELRNKLADDIRQFISDGKIIIGICNGFQILVKAGLLPGNIRFQQEASLIINDSGKFEDRWVYLKTEDRRQKTEDRCVWTKNLPEIIYLPVAHGEGKLVTQDTRMLDRLEKKGQVVFRYCNAQGESVGYPDNPNGSVADIAGITDETGRILGMMPHPERHITVTQHPRWAAGDKARGDGLQIFMNGVEYVRNNL